MLVAGGSTSATVHHYGGRTLSIAGAEAMAWGFLEKSTERCREEMAGYHGASLGACRMHSLITVWEEAPGRSHG